METAELPPSWDWVTAVAGCSGRKFFENLYLGALANIAKRMEINPPTTNRATFQTTHFEDVFSVFSESSSGPVIRFVLRGREISIQEEHGAVNLSGTVTLDDKGRCRLRIGAEELDEWQVLKRALEILLFGPGT